MLTKFVFLIIPIYICKNSNITSATSGKDQLVICDSNGIIHVFTKTWESVSFKGHDGEIFLCEMQRLNTLLVTIGVSSLNCLFCLF